MLRRRVVLFAIVLASAKALLLAGPGIQSNWKPPDLRVDGVMTDWTQLTPVSKEVSAAAANDGQDLYIIVATSNPAARAQIMRAGLAVYLDSKGKKGKAFGLRIPPIGARLAPGNGTPRPDDPPLLSYFDVLGPGDDDVRRVEVADSPGIKVSIGDLQGTFFLELQVPLMTGLGRPYAPGIEVAKGAAGLGIVTPDPPRMAPRGGDRGSAGGGRAGGRGGGGARGGGARGGDVPGGPGGDQGKAIKVWTTVALAKVG